MATLLNAVGYRSSHRTRSASSLIELLVVIFIIGVLLSLMMPALSGSRNRAQATVCRNNIRQLKLAFSEFGDSRRHVLPDPNHWTIDILKWIEEQPLADRMSAGIDPKVKYPRPPLYDCPMQPEFDSNIPPNRICHYVLAIDRPDHPARYEDIGAWDISDRELLSDGKSYDPWYVGPELTLLGQQSMFANGTGPHSGLFQTDLNVYPLP
jgi:type II secretory pathway pseudopilin PulG